MTLRPDPGPVAPIGLPDFLARIEASGFDPACEAAYLAIAPLLAGLSAHRTFLGDLMIRELECRASAQERDNDYGPQVILLHRGPGWFVRANVWPDGDDPLLRASGAERFFYGIPHDHNFTFLTAGHFGPGYWSDYYDFDPAAVAGAPGETAGLRFVERSRLEEGTLLLYRARRDVHSQHPPDTTSVSLNICQGTAGQGFIDQYRFDVDRDLIAGQLAVTPTEAMLALMPTMGGADGLGLLADFARGHPGPRIRFAAVAALAGKGGGALSDRRSAIERACDDPDRTVAALARARIDLIERAEPWLAA